MVAAHIKEVNQSFPWILIPVVSDDRLKNRLVVAFASRYDQAERGMVGVTGAAAIRFHLGGQTPGSLNGVEKPERAH